MITLVWRTDVHLADKAPQSRTDDWAETVLGKLRQVGEIAREVEADAVIDGGDFFHIKTPSRTTHELIQRVAAVHAEYPCPVYGLTGNHDVKYGDPTFLGEAPLGVLFSTGVFRPFGGDTDVSFRNEVKVRLVGVPYHGKTYDMNRLTTIVKGDEDYLMVAAHLLASQAGGEMFGTEDIVRYADLVNLDPQVWCFCPGTQVIDWNGCPVPIESVSGSQALMGRSGSTVIAQVHPVREVDEDIVVMDVEGVPSDLIPGVTTEHPFWIAKGLRCRLPSRASRRCHPEKVRSSYPCTTCVGAPVVNPDWTRAADIKPGDYVSIPFPKIPTDAALQPSLARILGYYVAEGHIIENRKKEPVAGVGWSFHVEERELHADVQRIVQEHFGVKTYEHSLVKYGNNSVQVCAYGPDVTAFCLENGGRYSSQKVLSPWVWGLSVSSRLELLVGWMLGDGHARSVKTEVMGGTSSPALATQMFLLALSVGLRPYYTIRPAGFTTFPDGHSSPVLPHHIITFYGDDADMLARRMGVQPPKRSKTKVAGFFHDGLFWRRVRSVSREHYMGPVHNMRTSTNEYVAGLLLTHNCFGHWHKNQGVYEAGGKHIVNIGSLTRGALSEDDVKRIPEVAILRFTSEGIRIEQRPLKVQPPAEVFDLEDRTRQEARQMTVDAFVESVVAAFGTKDRKPLLDEVREMDLIDPVKERILLYLEAEGAS